LMKHQGAVLRVEPRDDLRGLVGDLDPFDHRVFPCFSRKSRCEPRPAPTLMLRRTRAPWSNS
jgi:hypothetical protein